MIKCIDRHIDGVMYVCMYGWMDGKIDKDVDGACRRRQLILEHADASVDHGRPIKVDVFT